MRRFSFGVTSGSIVLAGSWYILYDVGFGIEVSRHRRKRFFSHNEGSHHIIFLIYKRQLITNSLWWRTNIFRRRLLSSKISDEWRIHIIGHNIFVFRSFNLTLPNCNGFLGQWLWAHVTLFVERQIWKNRSAAIVGRQLRDLLLNNGRILHFSGVLSLRWNYFLGRKKSPRAI